MRKCRRPSIDVGTVAIDIGGFEIGEIGVERRKPALTVEGD